MRLAAGAVEMVVDPACGAGVLSLTVAGRPILSTGAGRPVQSPFAQAMNLLVPFSNRISAPFAFDGQRHAVPANLAGERFAIHGDGFQRPWTTLDQGPDQAILTLSGEIGPWRHETQVRYRLTPGSMTADLSVTNRSGRDLPFGGGFHPWFPRHAATRLGFAATGHWPEDEHHLPATRAPVPAPADWRFDIPAALPAGWINTCFSGWDGVASISQPGLDLRISARGCDNLVLYSPGTEAPFFCLEPVSHPVDAHNLPGQPGLRRLKPDETMTLNLTLAWTLASDGVPA